MAVNQNKKLCSKCEEPIQDGNRFLCLHCRLEATRPPTPGIKPLPEKQQKNNDPLHKIRFNTGNTEVDAALHMILGLMLGQELKFKEDMPKIQQELQNKLNKAIKDLDTPQKRVEDECLEPRDET